MSTLISKGVATSLTASTLSDNITSSQTFIPITRSHTFSSFTRAKIASTGEIVGYTGKTDNLLLHSQDYTQAIWDKGTGTLTANIHAAPDGTMTASRIVSNGVNNTDVSQLLNLPEAYVSPYKITFSVYLKYISGDPFSNVMVYDQNLGGTHMNTVNINTGQLHTNGDATSFGIVNVGNSWMRVHVSFDFVSSANVNYLFAYVSSYSNTSYYIWGAQFETYSSGTPTTYLPTTSTRLFHLTGATRGVSSTTAASATSGATITAVGISSILSENVTSSQTYIPVTSTTNFSSYTNAIIPSTNEVVSYTETSENYNSYSTTFASFFESGASSAKTSNATTAPDGTNTGLLLTATNATPQDSYIRFTATLVPGTQFTSYVYAKAGTANFLSMRAGVSGPTYPYAWFNLSTGAVGTVQTGLTASILNAGNGWFKCSITFVSGVVSSLMDLNIAPSNGNNNAVNGSTIFLWNVQTNLGSTAKTFIPTAALVPLNALTGVTRGANSTTAASATSGATVTAINTISTISRAHFVNCVATAGATTIVVTDQINTTLGELYLHNSGDSITIEKSPDDNVLLIGGAAKVSAVGSPRS